MKYPRRIRIFAVAAAVLAPGLGLSAHAARADGSQPHQAKVPIDDARAKALRLEPGKVVSEKLENEKARWIDSFEIKPTGGKRRLVKEVNIDADPGAVVSIDTEND